tara:strand:- start:58 stop:375 length:318 start_codon:yes stop_codon:yes gene_type:complete
MQRTEKQNNSLHAYCQGLADELNSAGLDMRVVLKPEYEIPWTKESVKEHLWRTAQTYMFSKKSTTELSTDEISQVYEVVNRHIAKHGISVPFPSTEEQLLTNQDD